MSKTLIDRFHDHLDRCEQCRNNPFDLCGIGQTILLATTRIGGPVSTEKTPPDSTEL